MVWKLPPPEWSRTGELEASRLAAAEAWRIVAADPVGYIARCLAKFPASFLNSNWAIDQLVLAAGQPWPRLANSVLLRFGPTLVELGVVITALLGLVRHRHSTLALLFFACLAQVLLFSIWFEFSERHGLFITPIWLLLAAVTVAKQPKPGRALRQRKDDSNGEAQDPIPVRFSSQGKFPPQVGSGGHGRRRRSPRFRHRRDRRSASTTRISTPRSRPPNGLGSASR